MVESVIYQKLLGSGVSTLVSGRINPDVGTTGTNVPYVSFGVTSRQSSDRLSGVPSSLEKCGVMVDSYAVKESDVLALMAAVKSELQGWREGDVKFCTLDNYGTEKQGDSEHYKGYQQFSVWYAGV